MRVPRSIMAVSLGLGWTAALACFAADVNTAQRPDAARYRLVPGQKLTYRSNWRTFYWKMDWSDFRISLHEEQMDFVVWVLRANPDGSYRMVVKVRDAMKQTRNGTTQAQPPTTQLIYADVFPDGRELPSHWRLTWGNVLPSLFPPLPPDAAAAHVGWDASPQAFRYRCKPVESESGLAFDARVETPYDKTLGDSHVVRYRFDAGRGLIVRSDDTFSRNGSITGSGGGTTTLLGVKTISPVALKELADDAGNCFAAVEAYDSRLEEAEKCEPEIARGVLSTAASELKSCATAVRQPDMKLDIEQRLALHDAAAHEILKSAADRASRIGKPAPDFQAVDLNGAKVRLSDFRGKVVILDFWYRGCGPCILTMPQMNQLAVDFAGQPVAILGMSTDADVADAQFMARQFALKYPVLRARDLSAQFGVQAFPTLIVIDPHGTIRKIHVGYSATLRDELGATIQRLESK